MPGGADQEAKFQVKQHDAKILLEKMDALVAAGQPDLSDLPSGKTWVLERLLTFMSARKEKLVIFTERLDSLAGVERWLSKVSKNILC